MRKPLLLHYDFSEGFPPIRAYGVTLVRLEPSHLELLRNHRNSPEIQQFMIYREHITEEMQRRWFDTVNNRFNHYAVIYYEGEPIGVSHTKNVDLETRSGEGGMMIWSPSHQNTDVPFRAALAGNDWVFDDLGLETLHVRVLASNKRAIRYNRALGYVFDPPAKGSDIVTGRLTQEEHERASKELRRILALDEG
jgi:RimJ/RimL family protein N-acetyltransferase